MSESDEIKLWCWVLGDPYKRVFDVTIKRSARIQELKKAIKGEKPSFNDIAADSIDLFKFQLDLEDFNEEDTQSINLKNGEELKPFKPVSFYWAEEPGNVLSIVLPRPAATITPSSSYNSGLSQNSPPPSWLVEIHGKLWGKRNLLGNIFRTATVTKEGFAKLQDLLDAKHPKRNFDDYVSPDVLATKAAFLRDQKAELETKVVDDGLVPRLELSSQPPYPDVVDDDVDMDDDAAMVVDNTHEAMAIDNTYGAMAIFPYTFQYMDVTGLQLKEVLRVPKLMLFRNDYVTMIDIFNKREKGTLGSAVFSGQPGIGKTCMLYYILILCIILGRPIVFQDIFGEVFVIGTTVLPLGTPGISLDDEDVLALVDADSAACQPNRYLLNHRQYRILLTSSPKTRSLRSWLPQMIGPRAMFMMDLWSREELVVASLLLGNQDITPKRLQEASRICGNIPRECFSAAVSPVGLEDAEKTIELAIKNTDNLSDAFKRVSVGGETVIHRIFQIRPSSQRRLWNDCFVEPVSDWAFLRLLEELHRRRAEAAYEFYCALKGCSEGNIPAGKAFEYQVHKYLQKSSHWTFTILSLNKPSATLKIRFTSNTKRFGDKKIFAGYLSTFVASGTPCYLQPLSPIFPSFDSFLYQPGMSESPFSPLIALQVTIASKHPVNDKGLKDLQDALNHAILTHLRPAVTKKMVIVFVIPANMRFNFKHQSILPSWAKKTDQYILALEEEAVFKGTYGVAAQALDPVEGTVGRRTVGRCRASSL